MQDQTESVEIDSAEIIIIGAGLAGLFTALKLAPRPVTIISAMSLGEGAASSWAQAGIAAAIGDSDTPEAHAQDTIRAGAGLVEPKIALSIAREAPDRIEDLLRYGVPFDRNLEGLLALSREAAHSARRIVRVKGDMAGRAIMSALIKAVRQQSSIKIIENHEARDLVMRDNRVTGVEIADMRGKQSQLIHNLSAGAVILAAGGIGQLYQVTTNPVPARGNAIAIAARAGAIIADAEFVQFHPTAINIGKDPAPLATEALRGEGAILVNGNDERFMKNAHDDAELAPRDIVARAVHREVAQGRGAFLDCRKAIGSDFADKFPTVFQICKNAGIDPTSDLIPIAPAAHYHMGGILTDALGRSSLDGLWACGEAASTGLHGANRLASNSLLEAVVFAARIARDLGGIVLNKLDRQSHLENFNARPRAVDTGQENELIQSIRSTMSKYVGVVRTDDGLKIALEKLNSIKRRTDKTHVVENMLCSAKFITTAAINREESRGSHFRADHPQSKSEFKKRSYLTNIKVDQHFTHSQQHQQRRHLSLVKSS